MWYRVNVEERCYGQLPNDNSFTCYCNSQTLKRMGVGSGCIVRVQLGLHSRRAKLFLLRSDDEIKSDFISLPSGDHFDAAKEVLVRPDSGLVPLEHVCFTTRSAHCLEHRAKIMRGVEHLLIGAGEIPASSESRISFHFDGQSIELDVADSSPALAGVIVASTEISLSFSVNGSSVNGSSPELFRFSFNLVAGSLKPLSATHIIENFLLQAKACFPYRIEELPSDLALYFLENQSLSLDLSSCAFVGDGSSRDPFCLVQGPNGRAVVLQRVRVESLPKAGVFVVPALLRTIRQHFEVEDGSLASCRLRAAPGFEAAFAQEANVSFLATAAYGVLSSAEVDAIMCEFFARPKYILPDSLVEVKISSFACREFHLKWKFPDESLYFRLLASRKEICSGVLISNERTKLYQRRFHSGKLPETYKMMSKPRSFSSSPEIISLAPSFLLRTVEAMRSAAACHVRSFLLLSAGLGTGSNLVSSALASALGFHRVRVDCSLLVADSSGATEARLRQAVAQCVEPCVLVLANVDRLAKNRDGRADLRVVDCLAAEIARRPGLVLGEAADRDRVEPRLAALFDHHCVIEALGRDERAEALQWIVDKEGVSVASDVAMTSIAERTSGFVFADLLELARAAWEMAVDGLTRRFPGFSADSGVGVGEADFEAALKRLHSTIADSLGAPKIPSVRWTDVGGLEDVKREILETIQMPLTHPELFKSGLKRSGILLYGPPGVGKTLLAKAVATECSLNFLTVKGPELLNMYVGQSEQNVREIFSRARSSSPCVIFFDELDSLAPNRGRSGDSGGVMDRVVSQLLAELDGLANSTETFVIGATNRPDLIDQALLRPGRFDRLVYIGVAEDKSEQLRILTSLTSKFTLADDVTLESALAMLPGALTGADMFALCSDASLAAIARKIGQLEAGEAVDESVSVTSADFQEAVHKFVPSVSVEELRRYKELKNALDSE